MSAKCFGKVEVYREGANEVDAVVVGTSVGARWVDCFDGLEVVDSLAGTTVDASTPELGCIDGCFCGGSRLGGGGRFGRVPDFPDSVFFCNCVKSIVAFVGCLDDGAGLGISVDGTWFNGCFKDPTPFDCWVADAASYEFFCCMARFSGCFSGCFSDCFGRCFGGCFGDCFGGCFSGCLGDCFGCSNSADGFDVCFDEGASGLEGFTTSFDICFESAAGCAEGATSLDDGPEGVAGVDS